MRIMVEGKLLSGGRKVALTGLENERQQTKIVKVMVERTANHLDGTTSPSDFSDIADF